MKAKYRNIILIPFLVLASACATTVYKPPGFGKHELENYAVIKIVPMEEKTNEFISTDIVQIVRVDEKNITNALFYKNEVYVEEGPHRVFVSVSRGTYSSSVKTNACLLIPAKSKKHYLIKYKLYNFSSKFWTIDMLSSEKVGSEC